MKNPLPPLGAEQALELLEALRSRDRKTLRRLVTDDANPFADPARLLTQLAQRLPLPWLMDFRKEILNLAGSNDSALLSVARVWRSLMAWEPAEHALRMLIARSPGSREPVLELVDLLTINLHTSSALRLLEPALAVFPGDPALLIKLGQIRLQQSEIEPALAAFQLAEDAGGPLAEKAGRQFILALAYLPDVTAEDLLEATSVWERRYAPPVARKTAPRVPERRRVRIGYYSPDLRRHSITHFFLPLLEAHDRSRFEVFVYSDTRFTDAFTQRMRLTAEHWIDLTSLPTNVAARRIASDRLDVLVDLAGHFGSTRPQIFAARPAPIQVHLLGYNGSTGLSSLDYRISDGICDPIGYESESSETVIRIDPGFHCFDPLVEPIDEGTAPVLRNGYVTLGCFNSYAKINTEVIELWSKVLHAIPDAHLVIKAIQLEDIEVRHALVEQFGQHGVSPERIEVLAGKPSAEDHLMTYREVDIALDPFPCNGTTTTCEALWMGVPVLTVLGGRHSARVSASLLSQIGFREGIAADPAEFVSIAKRWSESHGQIADWRSTLRKRLMASSVGDATAYARRVEAAYLGMIERESSPSVI